MLALIYPIPCFLIFYQSEWLMIPWFFSYSWLLMWGTHLLYLFSFDRGYTLLIMWLMPSQVSPCLPNNILHLFPVSLDCSWAQKKGSASRVQIFFHFKIQTYRKAIEIVERIPVYPSSRFPRLPLYYTCFLILSLSLCILFIHGTLVLWIATNTELANTEFLGKDKVGFP